MKKWATYFHTIRYLKPIQVYNRLWRQIYRPRPDLRPPPPLRRRSGEWTAPALRRPTLLAPDRFRFLNQECRLDFPAAWNSQEMSTLWRYHLHCFDDLIAADAGSRGQWHQALLTCWMDHNRPHVGVGWEPYPLSRRIVNWIKWSLAGNPLPERMQHSLAVQVRCLRRRLEYHLLGNHLLANAKALVFAGALFEGREPEAWLAQGLRILSRQIPEQILPDGGHFERSPMYHAIVLEDMLDLMNLTRAYEGHLPLLAGRGNSRPSNAEEIPLRDVPERMLRWLQIMTHPDGRFALFNDAAHDGAATPQSLQEYANRLGFAGAPSKHTECSVLSASGYARLQKGSATVILDAAAIGPDYIPGHGHADALTFELSLGTEQIVVDSGTSCYDECDQRLRQRSTSAHNTIMLDDRDSSELWGSFRVAKRARIVGFEAEEGLAGPRVRAVHNGYARFLRLGNHQRTWQLDEGSMRIEDAIDGSGRHTITMSFHFHPHVHLQHGAGQIVKLKNREGRLLAAVEFDAQLTVKIAAGTYHPEFGRTVPNQKAIGTLTTNLPCRLLTLFRWN